MMFWFLVYLFIGTVIAILAQRDIEFCARDEFPTNRHAVKILTASTILFWPVMFLPI